MMQIRILTADDHPLLREGIAAVVNDQPDRTVVSEAGTGHDALEAFVDIGLTSPSWTPACPTPMASRRSARFVRKFPTAAVQLCLVVQVSSETSLCSNCVAVGPNIFTGWFRCGDFTLLGCSRSVGLCSHERIAEGCYVR
jgi:DNA-binding NarL/FixJ family response regulator